MSKQETVVERGRRLRALADREPTDLTDAELHDLLRERYEPTVVPPCRVCGGPLSLVACGMGETVWACDGRAETGWKEGRAPADEHYGRSRFTDYQRRDQAVLELLRRHAAAEDNSTPRAWKSLSALRAAGWAVAVHNDYRSNGVRHTFWLFTKGDRAIKGEGRTDGEALAHCVLASGELHAETAEILAAEPSRGS